MPIAYAYCNNSFGHDVKIAIAEGNVNKFR